MAFSRRSPCVVAAGTPRCSSEVAAPLASRGAGIVTHPELRHSLEQLGLDPHRDFGVAIEQRRTLARDGGVVGTYDCPQVATSWDCMFRMLRAALPDECYTRGAEFRRCETVAGGGARAFRRMDVAKTARCWWVRTVCDRRCGRRCWARFHRSMPAMPPGAGCWQRRKVPADLFARFSFCLPPE